MMASADEPDDVTSVGKLISAQRAERELGVSATTLYRLMDAGQLPYYRFGTARRIAVRDLEQYLASARVGK